MSQSISIQKFDTVTQISWLWFTDLWKHNSFHLKQSSS